MPSLTRSVPSGNLAAVHGLLQDGWAFLRIRYPVLLCSYRRLDVAYMFKSLGGLMSEAAEKGRDVFGAFVSDPCSRSAYHVVVMAITTGIIYKGISGGIEVLQDPDACPVRYTTAS